MVDNFIFFVLCLMKMFIYRKLTALSSLSLILLFCPTLLFLSFLRIGNEWKRLSNLGCVIFTEDCMHAKSEILFFLFCIFLNKYQGRQKYWPNLNWEWEPIQRPEILWPEAKTSFLRKQIIGVYIDFWWTRVKCQLISLT